MDTSTAEALTKCLMKKNLRAYVDRGRVVFTGGFHGEASIDVECSSPSRVLAHWDGYCLANGVEGTPLRVKFPSRSMPGGLRTGTVVEVRETRATVAYVFKNGRKATANVLISKLRGVYQ